MPKSGALVLSWENDAGDALGSIPTDVERNAIVLSGQQAAANQPRWCACDPMLPLP